MEARELNVVTGAFGFTGSYITQRLLADGRRVRTLTRRSAQLNPFGPQVEVWPLDFENPAALARSLEGAATLYNTYWVRFTYGGASHAQAVENSRTLIRAAETAGVRRIVHVSVTNCSEDSPLDYFRGKALVEKAIRESKLSYAILRPALIFGPEDILLNNIAWLLRRFPFFAVPGAGDYKMRPIFVEDLAELALRSGQETGNTVLDAVGPETFTFDELLRLVARAVGRPARLLHVPPTLALGAAQLVSPLVRDVVLTRWEIEGLMANLLASDQPSTGQTRFSEWLAQNAASVGARYHSELARHYR